MTTTLQQIGEKFGVIIEPPVLSRLGITVATPLEIRLTSDGKGLLILPVRDDYITEEQARAIEVAKRMTEVHHETLKRLAE